MILPVLTLSHHLKTMMKTHQWSFSVSYQKDNSWSAVLRREPPPKSWAELEDRENHCTFYTAR